MFPELFTIPYLNFTINTYGVLLALAFIAGLLVMSRLAERDGLDKQRVYDLALWTIIASLIGSKLLMVVTEWESYRGDLRQIFSLDFLRSAGVFYGGFLGALLASVVAMRRYKLPWWRTADAFAPGIAIGQAIGRLGCFSAGCCWGKPTAAWCGVHFSDAGHAATQVPTVVEQLSDPIQQQTWSERLGGLTAPIHLHPTQLYESAVMFVVFGFLLWLSRRRQFHGQIVLAYALLYAIARFVIEFWRDDPRGALLGLSTSQFIALCLFVGALLAFLYKLRGGRQSAIRNPQSAI